MKKVCHSCGEILSEEYVYRVRSIQVTNDIVFEYERISLYKVSDKDILCCPNRICAIGTLQQVRHDMKLFESKRKIPALYMYTTYKIPYKFETKFIVGISEETTTKQLKKIDEWDDYWLEKRISLK